MGVLIIANLANFYEGGKTGLEGGKNIDPMSLYVFKEAIDFLFLKNKK